LRLWERLEEAESRIASTGRDNADRRLARLLFDLESYGNPQAPGHGVMAGTEIPVKLSQEEFASWIGASRKRLNARCGVAPAGHRLNQVPDHRRT
jgi:hypothetical protein